MKYEIGARIRKYQEMTISAKGNWHRKLASATTPCFQINIYAAIPEKYKLAIINKKTESLFEEILCSSSSWNSPIKRKKRAFCSLFFFWWAIGDSNPGPTGYEPVALTNWANGPTVSISTIILYHKSGFIVKRYIAKRIKIKQKRESQMRLPFWNKQSRHWPIFPGREDQVS